MLFVIAFEFCALLFVSSFSPSRPPPPLLVLPFRHFAISGHFIFQRLENSGKYIQNTLLVECHLFDQSQIIWGGKVVREGLNNSSRIATNGAERRIKIGSNTLVKKRMVLEWPFLKFWGS